MERSEPALVPEWLRNTGSVSGGGNSAHHFVPSYLHSDVRSPEHSTRNRCLRSASDKYTTHSAFLDRTSSCNSRRSSSGNGSSKHPYSSFGRSHRDKKCDKEKDRSAIGDLWDHDSSDPLDDILISRAEKDGLRRTHSLLCRKPGEVLPRRAVDSNIGGSNNKYSSSSNGVVSGGFLGSSAQKTAFEKDFPSLGTEEKLGVSEIGRVSSPGLSTATQSFGNPGLIGGEGWTSALAEVPTLIGSNSMGPTSVQQIVLSTPSSGAPSPNAGLNMAETLSHAPSHARSTPQLPDKTQRLEELAIKQSRQLIPMTPSTSKASVLSSDKSKPKTALRTSEMTVAAKSVQQQPHSSQIANQSLGGGQVRSDTSRSSHSGKFLVLKPGWENGVSSMAKDVSGPSNNASRVTNSQLGAAPTAPSISLKSPNSSKHSALEQKVAALALNSGVTVEKRSFLSQAQSRNDFFNLMRKKTSTNTSGVLSDSGVVISSPIVESSSEVVKEGSADLRPCATENGSGVTGNGDTHDGEKNLCIDGAVYPDEEEAAFLRSLGWEENTGEDDGLTEEEINAFYEECMKLRPTLKLCRGVQPKLPMLSESHTTGSSRASSGI